MAEQSGEREGREGERAGSNNRSTMKRQPSTGVMLSVTLGTGAVWFAGRERQSMCQTYTVTKHTA